MLMCALEAKQTMKSANLHLIGSCNYRCDHCFSRPLEKKLLTPDQWKPILSYLKVIGVEKVNIAGGEPLLYQHLEEMLKLIKSMGFRTSIVSNGSRITEEWLDRNHDYLDWLGLSVDSPDDIDEIDIGRHVDGIDHVSNVIKIAKYEK